jgi:diketogulonate reductase-like aldo/keto reductase
MASITLNSGVEMPVLGFGVFQTPPDETRDADAAALGSGYCHTFCLSPRPAAAPSLPS